MEKLKVFRCYVTRVPEGHWETFCIDLCLAARGDTREAAAEAMMAQLSDYLEYALQEESEEDRDRLLSRRAPASQILKYHSILLANKLKSIFDSPSQPPQAGGGTFDLPMPKAA